VDLNKLWTQLGVQSDGASVRFDDSAALAPIRRAITARAFRGGGVIPLLLSLSRYLPAAPWALRNWPGEVSRFPIYSLRAKLQL